MHARTHLHRRAADACAKHAIILFLIIALGPVQGRLAEVAQALRTQQPQPARRERRRVALLGKEHMPCVPCRGARSMSTPEQPRLTSIVIMRLLLLFASCDLLLGMSVGVGGGVSVSGTSGAASGSTTGTSGSSASGCIDLEMVMRVGPSAARVGAAHQKRT